MRRRAFIVAGMTGVSVALAAGAIGYQGSERDIRESPPSDHPSATDEAFMKLQPGWNEMRPPPEPRSDAVTAWVGRQQSGRDLVLWGGTTHYDANVYNDGFTWDAATGEWRDMASSPLSPRSDAGSVYTGQELVIWGGHRSASREGAAYDPAQDSWRALSPSPIPATEPVCMAWTGEEVFVWGSTDRPEGSRQGALYDPAVDSWRSIADAPVAINQGFCEWTGSEIIVFGSLLDDRNWADGRYAFGIAYSPSKDAWRELPATDLSPQASAIGWTGRELLAWDYDLNAALYEPRENRWSDVPDVPGEFSECYPASTEVNRYVLTWYCGRGALWDFVERDWRRVPPPDQEIFGAPVTAGEVVIFVGGVDAEHNSMWIYVAPT